MAEKKKQDSLEELLTKLEKKLHQLLMSNLLKQKKKVKKLLDLLEMTRKKVI